MPGVKRRRRETPEQRADRLEREYNAALDTMAAALYGPITKVEASHASSRRSAFRRQTSGVTRAGKTSTVSGRKMYARNVKTPKQARRDAAEREVEKFIRSNPEHPVAKQWRERTDELDAARRQVEADEDFLSPRRRVHVRSYEHDRPPVTDVKAHTRRWPRLARIRTGG